MLGHALGAGMGAMRGGEGVVHIDVAELGKCCGECRVVLFLARRGSGCSPAPARRHRACLATASSATGPMQSSAKAHRLAQHRRQRRGDRRQRHLRHALAFRAVEMAEHDDLRALLRQLADGGDSRSRRVRSVILPSCTGTLRSARSSTRLPRYTFSMIERHWLTAHRNRPRCRTCGWRSPTRCRTSPSPGSARHPPPRSASHRRCRTPGSG